MGKDKLKIKKPPKKTDIISNDLNQDNKKETSILKSNNFEDRIIQKKKIKKRIFLNEIKSEKSNYKIKYKSKTNYIKKVKKENQDKDIIDDKTICAHLLLNSYVKTNNKDFLPEKTINQRINSMREKILNIFPELSKTKTYKNFS